MAEVMLSLQLEADENQRATFDEEMTRRRWSRVPGLRDSWTCYFDGGFIVMVRRIVAEDVRKSARRAGIARWVGAHSLASVPCERLGPMPTRSAGAARAPAETWTDSGVCVGPPGEVMLTLRCRQTTPGVLASLDAALEGRGWKKLAGLESSWAHAFDLGMYTPIAAIVEAELREAMALTEVHDWRAAWSLSSWEHTPVFSPVPPSPGPYHSWRW